MRGNQKNILFKSPYHIKPESQRSLELKMGYYTLPTLESTVSFARLCMMMVLEETDQMVQRCDTDNWLAPGETLPQDVMQKTQKKVVVSADDTCIILCRHATQRASLSSELYIWFISYDLAGFSNLRLSCVHSFPMCISTYFCV